jgi:hypothetical protein
VTALTQHWSAHGEHAGMIGTVWVVTIAAIFGDWCVLPEIRPAFLSMTAKTRVIKRLLCELQLVGRTVIVVAAAAIHLALSNRMRIRL